MSKLQMKRFAVGLLTLCFVPQADAFTASELYLLCTQASDTVPGGIASSTCIGYMRGVVDGLFMAEILADQGMKICTPNKRQINAFQAKDVIQKYIEKNPEYLQSPAGIIASGALYRAFPCENSN